MKSCTKWEVLDNCGNILEPYQCHFCEFTTNFRVELQKHVRTCTCYTHDIEAVVLTIPEFEYASDSSTKEDLIDALDCKTTSKKYLSCVSDAQNQWFSCNQCDYKAKTKISLHLHKRLHDPRYWLKCDQCEYTTTYKGSLKRHQISKHLEENQIQWISCNQCEFKTKLQDRMTQHVKCMHGHHSATKWYNCAHCNFRTKRKFNREQHESMHYPRDQIEWHHCHLCDYRGRIKKLLTKHIKNVHDETKTKRVSGPRFMKCEHCPYETTKKIYLEEHRKSIHPEITTKNAHNKAVEPAAVGLFKCGACQFSANNQNAVVSHIMTTHVSIVPSIRLTTGSNIV